MDEKTKALGSELNDGLGGRTDFEIVMEGLGELAEHTGPNDAAQYALAAIDMKKQMDRYREALNKLARLGNEPRYGNSIGNRIAQDALGIEVGVDA